MTFKDSDNVSSRFLVHTSDNQASASDITVSCCSLNLLANLRPSDVATVVGDVALSSALSTNSLSGIEEHPIVEITYRNGNERKQQLER